MTADVDANVNSSVSTIETEEKCGFGVNGGEDLPTTASVDYNGHKNGNEIGSGNAGDDVVAGMVAEPADGRSNSIEEVGSLDAAESVVDLGGSPMKYEVQISDGKKGINGAVEIPNGFQGEIEAEQDEVNLNTVVEHSEESLISVLESDNESKSMESSVNAAKDEKNGIIGSTVIEESQVTNNAEIAEPEPNHSGNVERKSCETVFESEQSEVISSIGIAESVQDQLGEAEIISHNNINGSEESRAGEAETICINSIAESEYDQSGEVEVSITTEAGESELNQSGDTEDSNIEKKQHSSVAFTKEVQDDDVDLNHGEKTVGCDSNFSNNSQETSEVELSQNIEATSCVVGVGAEPEAEKVSKVTLSEEYANGLSAGSAEDDVAESSVVDCISSAHKFTPLQNGGSEELGSTEIITSADADDSIKDSKNEFDMDDTQLESGVSNGHVACQNGETLPTDHGEECDSQEDISRPSQTLLESDSPSEVCGAVSSSNIAVAEHESIPVDPVSDTTLEVENGYSCSNDGALEPAIDNGHSHPTHDNETYEARIESVDEKFNSSFGNDAIPETKANTITIKFGAFPAFSCDVASIESKSLGVAVNDADNNPDREVCAHAVDVKADSEIKNSLMLTREAPSDEGPASKPNLDSSAADVKAESEVEDSVVVPSVVSQDDGLLSEPVSTENPVDVTTDSQCEVSAILLGGIPHGDAATSEPQVLDGSGGGTQNDILAENKDNQFRIHGGEKKSEEVGTANADNQAEASPSSPEGIDGQHLVAEGDKRLFYYMVKVPRYDYGENLREQIKRAQNQVDEKTKSRDVIRAEMQKQRACRNEFGALLEDAVSEETVARDLFKAKRKEFDSVVLVINKMRGVRDLGEIDSKIRNMEHMLQHETLALKEEKNYIRMIQQLKQNRESMLSSLSKQEDLTEDADQKEQVEERLKILRKELDQLRDKVIKAEAATKIASKKFQDEKAKLNDLAMQFRAADDVRQKAYADLQSLKEQSYDKSKYFREYKDDLKAAYDLLSKGDKHELHSHCVNQVEKIMELWNSNDEFRREYIRCNIRSTLRRLQTLDGRSLGPDEEPPVIPYLTERADKGQTIRSTPLVEENANAPLKKFEKKADQPIEKPVDQIKPTAKSFKTAKPAPHANGFASESQSREIEETPEPEKKLTKEEAELIRKAEELRKEEEAAMLREQRRMEEKAKAKEAMERKKRIAEKAQARAAARAQKEAEKKEKEREKRAKKKEKSKATEEVNKAENAQDSAIPPEPVEKPITQTKKPQKPTQFTKQLKPKSSMPLPLRNRGKRRMQTWMWALLATLVILSIFLLGNANFSLPRFGF